MHRFFVYHPVFAWVIALCALLFGGIAISNLPVEQFPNVAPPSLNIQAFFAGADAQTLDRSVTSIIEKEMNGVDNFLYMSATSRSNGSATVTVTFVPGTDLNVASSQVQDRLGSIEPRMPDEVRQSGIRVTQSSSGFLMLINLQSRSGSTTALEMGDFASSSIVDELNRIHGVGDVTLFGSSFAMRIWLDREKLAGYGLSAAEVLAAVREQNSQTAGGGLGLQPVDDTTEFTAQIITQNRFTTAQQFREIIVAANPDGSTVRLGDVARVELGTDNYAFRSSLNGAPAAGIAVALASGANALTVAHAVRQRMHELEVNFPPDITWSTPFDTTPFVAASVRSVAMTMIEAMVLVSIVVFLFLQKWQTSLVPTIVVPIALVGACLGLWIAGMSLNLLSLFAMVVAIGILNDDAIVIVENVERIMRDEGLDSHEATVKAMGQITSAIIATTLVLIAVFTPMAFFPGTVGRIYQQFSVTLSVSITVSTILSLTLAPALTAALLKGTGRKPDRQGGWLRRVFDGFNRLLDRGTAAYVKGVDAMLAKPLRWLAVFAVACVATVLLFMRLPGGFLPTEDQGLFFAMYMGPVGATVDRTQEAVDQAEKILRQQPQVRNVVSIIGFSFFGQAQSTGMSFVDLHPWAERRGRDDSASAVVRRANMAFFQIPQATAIAIDPPPIPGLGTAGGFTMKIQDRVAGGGEELQRVTQLMIAEAARSPILTGVRYDSLPPAPQLRVEIDRVKARALGLQIGQVNQALSIAFGSAYANDFIHQGNVLRVLLQADAPQRMRPEDIAALRVRNNVGEMVPFSAFTRMRWTSGPQQLERYNGFPATTLSGQAAPGHGSGTALREMERIAAKVLPRGFAFEWTGTAFEEKQAAGQIGALLALSVVVVFLLLAAMYESWSIPIAVLLVVPLGVIGAVLLTMARGMSADVYFNVGLITIIGLAAKNAILIVQFALEQEAQGRDSLTAVEAAAQQRLRPILMTSFTFVIGMVPLVIASGAGAASRQAVGTGVMGSMLTATLFGIFFTPLFFVAARRWLSRKRVPANVADDASRADAPGN